MTIQYTPQQIEKILDKLPRAGNGAWSVRQKIVSRREGDATSTSVTSAALIGPGDKHVGDYVSPMLFKPHGGVGYWYIVQMEEAGWQLTEDMIGIRREEE